jgi:hypothetical protein
LASIVAGIANYLLSVKTMSFDQALPGEVLVALGVADLALLLPAFHTCTPQSLS